MITERNQKNKKDLFLLSSLLLSLSVFPFLPWGEDASHAIWFRAECQIQTHLTSDNVNSWRLAPVHSQPVWFAINKSWRVRGKDERRNPAGVVDVSLFFCFFHPEQSRDPGGLHKCSKAFVYVLWYTIYCSLQRWHLQQTEMLKTGGKNTFASK